MPNVDRLSTLTPGYISGMLSVYPTTLDTPNQLYQVSNNAETVLAQSLSYNGQYIVVEDTSAFPPQGIVNIGTELIYYDLKNASTFQNLDRSFAGSSQYAWPKGTAVTNAVTAEPHNATKDALINIENNLGVAVSPVATSLNGILQALETRFLAPKPIFRAAPISGPAPLAVRFQNFSGGPGVRYLWDFGDGGTSLDFAPVHTYVQEGTYTVTLNMITSLGAQGIATKTSYINVNNTLVDGFYYVTPAVGTTDTVFTFVDQTAGVVISRYWIFDDGETDTEIDPDVHATTHQYASAGVYNTALIVVFSDQTLNRYIIDPIIVS